MNNTEKALIKLLAQIESHQSKKLLFKPCYQGHTSALYCFEILMSNKDKSINSMACTFFLDCKNQIIYLDDYGTVFSGQNEIQNEIKDLFTEGFNKILDFIKAHDILHFRKVQVTSRIPDKFEFLKSIGFKQMEQLNHYGNTKFVYLIS